MDWKGQVVSGCCNHLSVSVHSQCAQTHMCPTPKAASDRLCSQTRMCRLTRNVHADIKYRVVLVRQMNANKRKMDSLMSTIVTTVDGCCAWRRATMTATRRLCSFGGNSKMRVRGERRETTRGGMLGDGEKVGEIQALFIDFGF